MRRRSSRPTSAKRPSPSRLPLRPRQKRPARAMRTSGRQAAKATRLLRRLMTLEMRCRTELSRGLVCDSESPCQLLARPPWLISGQSLGSEPAARGSARRLWGLPWASRATLSPSAFGSSCVAAAGRAGIVGDGRMPVAAVTAGAAAPARRSGPARRLRPAGCAREPHAAWWPGQVTHRVASASASDPPATARAPSRPGQVCKRVRSGRFDFKLTVAGS